MSRYALLVGNSVSYSDLSKSVTPAALSRTFERLGALLASLDPEYAFKVTTCIDKPARHVLSTLATAANDMAGADGLLLVYYFGHGVLDEENKLEFLQPASSSRRTERMALEALENRVRESRLRKSLFLLDCCYAGAATRSFPSTLRGDHCRISSTVPAQRAYVVYNNTESAIGAFTSAVMDAFTDPDACVSLADDTVSPQSLFSYLERVLTRPDQENLQSPKMIGQLQLTLFHYRAAPKLKPEFSSDANAKTAYAKIVAFCRALEQRSFSSIDGLHKALIRDFPESFKTLVKRSDGMFGYVPVQVGVAARYARLMERLGLIARGDDFVLSNAGRELARHWKARCNEILLQQIDAYLLHHGSNREQFVDATRRVLQGRLIPTQQRVADRLILSGLRIPKSDIGILLDLLGYSGVLQIAGNRAYFPWSDARMAQDRRTEFLRTSRSSSRSR
jgi:hypothetical protein